MNDQQAPDPSKIMNGSAAYQTEVEQTPDNDIEVTVADVPLYLQESEYYRSLCKDGKDATLISVPNKCFKLTDAVDNVDDLVQLLRVFLYWGLDNWPQTLLNYCATVHISKWESSFDAAFADIKVPIDLCAIKTYFSDTHDFQSALLTNQTDILDHWLSLHPPHSEQGERAVFVVVQFQVVHVLQDLHARGYSWGMDACIEALRCGSVECLKFLYQKGGPWDGQASLCSFAAAYSRMDCLECLHGLCCEWDKQTPMRAALSGSVECLMYAHENGCPWDATACVGAATYNSLACLEYVHTNGCAWDETLTEVAAQRGSLECLQYALENGCPIHEKVCLYAASKGHCECIDLLVQYVGNWCDSLPIAAAANGQFTMLKHLLDNNCPYNESLLINAVSSQEEGALLCVRYLIEEQLLTMDKFIYSAAIYAANFEVVQYLVDIGCDSEFSFFPGHPLRKDWDAPLLECVQHSVEHGSPLLPHLVVFIEGEDLPMTKQYFQGECPAITHVSLNTKRNGVVVPIRTVKLF